MTFFYIDNKVSPKFSFLKTKVVPQLPIFTQGAFARIGLITAR